MKELLRFFIASFFASIFQLLAVKFYVVFVRDSNPSYGAGFCACHTKNSLYISKSAAEKVAEKINKENHANPGGTFWAYVSELEMCV